MKKSFLIWFIWGLLFVIADEITNYFIEHSMLETFNVLLIELMFLGLGYLCAILEYKHKEKGKKK